jgi:epoxyqueuosine reductase
MSELADKIKDRAVQMGYEKCAIIKIEDVADYADKLKERMSRIFMGQIQFSRFKGFADPKKQFPWAKSIIVLSYSIAEYKLPDGIEGMYGKAFMLDGRVDENSEQWKLRQSFKAFLEDIGIKCVDEAKFGVTGLRWAAHKAGIGVIRRNNFFYTESSGSYCMLEAWLIDRELELKETPDFKACPDNCGKCIEACPTNSLNAPYTMSMIKCAAFITSMSTANGMGNTGIKTAAKLGKIVYGCDICQDVCPFNKAKLTGIKEFFGLSEISGFMLPDKIMQMTYEEINSVLAPKYWYIDKQKLWKWKLNALGCMMNNPNEQYREYIELGLKDSDRRVRSFAKKVIRFKI